MSLFFSDSDHSYRPVECIPSKGKRIAAIQDRLNDRKSPKKSEQLKEVKGCWLRRQQLGCN